MGEPGARLLGTSSSRASNSASRVIVRGDKVGLADLCEGLGSLRTSFWTGAACTGTVRTLGRSAGAFPLFTGGLISSTSSDEELGEAGRGGSFLRLVAAGD